MTVLCEVCFNSEYDLFTSSLYHPNTFSTNNYSATFPKDIFEHYNFLVGMGTNLSEKEIQDGGECRSSVWSPFSGQIINPPCSCCFFCPVMYEIYFLLDLRCSKCCQQGKKWI